MSDLDNPYTIAVNCYGHLFRARSPEHVAAMSERFAVEHSAVREYITAHLAFLGLAQGEHTLREVKRALGRSKAELLTAIDRLGDDHEQTIAVLQRAVDDMDAALDLLDEREPEPEDLPADVDDNGVSVQRAADVVAQLEEQA